MSKRYKVTTKLMTAMDQNPAISKSVDEYIRNCVRILGNVKGAERAFLAAGEVDREIRNGLVREGNDLLCPKCTSAHCCTQLILVSQNEMEWIRGLDDWREKVNEERLSWQLENVRPDTAFQPDYAKLDVEKRTCIFLGKDKRCGIYSRRPLICRTHYVFGSGENICAPTNRPQMVEQLVCLGAEIVVSAMLNVSRRAPIAWRTLA